LKLFGLSRRLTVAVWFAAVIGIVQLKG